MLANILSASVTGLEVQKINVEVDASKGLPSWDIVGLPDTAVRESKERVHAAIKNSGFDFPPRKIVVNLAPADLKKEGPYFDLPIAIAILSATEQINTNSFKNYIFIGELSLDGSLNHVNGILPIASSLKDEKISLITPTANTHEAALSGITTYGFHTLKEVVSFLNNPTSSTPTEIPNINELLEKASEYVYDFSDIKGQKDTKRALEIAAAGNHNIIMIGPPGSGKSLLAKSLPSILPPLTLNESLEISKIHSIAGLLNSDKFFTSERPFRSPHHTASPASLIGGGRIPRPGEISLAQHGILFMDEFPEYRREVLEALRQPLEDKIVTVARVTAQITYPCDFLLVAAMNPCPCGYLNDPNHECICTPNQISRYLQKISGPLIDRIDIQIETTPVEFNDLYDGQQEESSHDIRKRIINARSIQYERFKDQSFNTNSNINHKHLKKYCKLDTTSKNLLEKAFYNLKLSARAHDRILRLARTIADLDNAETIKSYHLAEAIQYRSLDTEKWRF